MYNWSTLLKVQQKLTQHWGRSRSRSGSRNIGPSDRRPDSPHRPLSFERVRKRRGRERNYRNLHQNCMRNWHRRFVQDGGVEGCALTPSCKSTRITANYWTIINRKTLELTKKETPHPKTKEKPQWDGRRGAITIKSNPITTGWVTHKLENTYTTEVHPLEWRFWAPHQVSNLGLRQREEEFPENQTLKSSRIWLQDFDRSRGNRDSTLGGHTQSSVCIRTQGKEQWPHRRLKQTYLLVLEGRLWRQGAAVAHHRDKDTHSRSSGKYSLVWALPESATSPNKGPVGSSAGSPQAKQPTGRKLRPTHQQTSRLNFYWALPTRATPSSTHHQSLPSGSLHKPLR